jgi:hypothetical protein
MKKNKQFILIVVLFGLIPYGVFEILLKVLDRWDPRAVYRLSFFVDLVYYIGIAMVIKSKKKFGEKKID